jgi:hypothetical protein
VSVRIDPSWRALLLVTALVAGPSMAADPTAALLACRKLADGTARLACFDRESAALVTGGEVAQLPPEQKFGLSPAALAAKEPAAARAAEVAELQARLVELKAAGDGRAIFILDNNQVWRQLEPGDGLLVKPGDVVQLSRGALGSFWLRAPSGRRCKVTRDR